jgi:ASC-1-like (ASCH) protein
MLVFNRENKDIYGAIRSGAKKVETRAATSKYQSIKKGAVGALLYAKLVTINH